ncbi:extracellular solute-binding protein [Paenibacillus sp.]|uniref:extracellular solute-binding protein n=1 Tax=Paenibacillus sp. TaxID=58172 RepID=UPI00281127A5|nr:extracellular solute-binding protein [Paenibacillus sp.]
MKTLQKGLSVSLAVALMSTALLACSTDSADEPKPAPQSEDGGANGGESSAEGALLNKEGFPIVNEPISLKIFARKAPPNGPYEDMLMFKEYEKMTGIDIVWEDVPDEGFAERKNLLFASNELPDALYKAGITPLEAIRYGSSGMLVPLEELLESYAPNITALFDQYPEIRASITAPDGHIYALPAILTLGAARTNKHWMNMAWLDAVGMEVPETHEDVIEVLRAFRDGDPNGNGRQDEIPLSTWNLPDLINSMSGSFGLQSQMGYRINIDNDKVDLWLEDDRFKQLLEFLHQLYSEKLVDQELLTHTGADYVAKMGEGSLGYFFNQASDPFVNRKEDYAGIAPFVGPNGDRMVNGSPVARDFGTFAITSVNKYPEATMRWIDYFFSEEGSIFMRYGIEGETFDFQPDGKPEYTEAVLTDPRGTGVTIGQFTPWPGGGSPQYVNVNNASAINPPEVQAAQEALDPYLPEKIYGAPMFDEQTAKEVNTLRQDIDAFVDESAAKFVTGALSFDKWGEYVDTLKKMNLEQLQKFYQDAYDKTK